MDDHKSQFEFEELINEPVSEEPKHQTPATPRRLPLFVSGVILGVIVVAIAGFVVIAVFDKDSRPAAAVHAALAYTKGPVATVNGKDISYRNYQKDLKAVKTYFETDKTVGTGITDAQIQEEVLKRLIITTVIEQELDTFGVKLTDEMLTAVRTDIGTELTAGGGTLEESVKKTFGWSLKTFEDQLVYPLALEREFQKTVKSRKDEALQPYVEVLEVRARHILFPKEEKEKATQVLARIKKGEDFATLAKEFGTDGSKDNGGDLGWFERGRMIPEFEAVAFEMKPQDVSELVETEFGYHIIKVEELALGPNPGPYLEDKLKSVSVVMHHGFANPLTTNTEEGA